MRALLDARLGRKPTGIGNYVLELGAHLPALAPGEIDVICRPRHRRYFAAAGARTTTQLSRSRLPRRLPSVDLVHGPNFHAPDLGPKITRVATIHDVGYLQFPECHPPGMPERLDSLVRESLRGTTRFLCDSRATAEAFAQAYGVNAERLAVTPLAVDAATFEPSSAPPREAEVIRARYKLGERYVLFVGAMVPRKDLGTLIRAWGEVARSAPDLHLALVGNKTLRWASDWPRVEAWLEANRDLAPRVRVLDYLASSELPPLYRAASAVMLTSLVEGFGLTVLEAMAAETPVVVTGEGALLEVGGTAAYYGIVRDPDSFAQALLQALERQAWERRLVESRAIVARHGWDRTAKLTLSAYRAALASKLR